MLVQRDLDEFVPVPEGRIHFVKTGKGSPLVLFHPLGNSTWVWESVMEPLGQHFTTYAFDMMGHGQSDKPNRDFAMSDFAQAVDHAMQVLNIHRAHIVGNSVGAVLATEVAASFPDRVDRLVLVGAPVGDPRNAPERLKDLSDSYEANGMPKPRTLEESTNSFVNPRQEWVDQSNAARNQAGIWVKKTMEALVWYDICARLPLIKASASLVLYGEHDRLREGEDILRYGLPNASKVILPGLGHIPQVEDPEAFLAPVLEFLT